MLQQKTLVQAVNKISQAAEQDSLSAASNAVIDKYIASEPWLTNKQVYSFISMFRFRNIAEGIQLTDSGHYTKTVYFYRKSFSVYQGVYEMLAMLLHGYHVHISKQEGTHLLMACYLELLQAEYGEQLPVAFTDKKMMSSVQLIMLNSGAITVQSRPYFRKMNCILIKSKKSVLVINANDSPKELSRKANSLFFAFGLMNQSAKLVLFPKGYDITRFFDAIQNYHMLIGNNRYANNYDYMKSIFLVKNEKHFDTGFALFKNNTQVSQVPSVYHYAYYSNTEELEEILAETSGVEFVYTTLELNKGNIKADFDLAVDNYYAATNLIKGLKKSVYARVL